MAQHVLAFMLGCMLALNAPSAFAQAREPAGARLALDDARAVCRKARGLKLTVDPQAIRAIDLNGDGRTDYVVNWEHLTCERRPDVFCGTGGCPLSIVVALPGGGYRTLFSQQVIRHEVEEGSGARTIRFDLHGTYCGKTGPEPCSRRQTIATRRFAFRQPP